MTKDDIEEVVSDMSYEALLYGTSIMLVQLENQQLVAKVIPREDWDALARDLMNAPEVKKENQ